jgi:thymidylate synthase
MVSPGPVITEYACPTERVLFWDKRDANPFFHLLEALWMLAGRNDVAFVSTFSANMKMYTDDGISLHGAYGFRWRKHFGFDQLERLVAMIKSEPTTRRAVLQIYDPWSDTIPLSKPQSRDIPCNTSVYFSVSGGALDMTVCNRSNDVIWGAYGANAVHFSMLQEFMAAMVGYEVGIYRQFSNNFHIYEPHWPLMHDIEWSMPEGYSQDIHPLVDKDEPYDIFMRDVDLFLRDPISFVPETSFLREVARPMAQAILYRKGKHGTGLEFITHARQSNDWITAGTDWIQRRRHVRKDTKAA